MQRQKQIYFPSTPCDQISFNGGKESKRSGEERKWKVQIKTAVSLLNLKICLLRMPRFLEADILHLEKRATGCSPNKQRFGKFSPLVTFKP